MLVAIGALLGIPAWILLGWLAGGLWHRYEINKLPHLFKTKVRMVSGTTGLRTTASPIWWDTQYGPTTF